jgi:hypothetical protein
VESGRRDGVRKGEPTKATPRRMREADPSNLTDPDQVNGPLIELLQPL